jgi:hypothetical protein
VAPKARWPLPLPARVVVEVLLFGVDGAHRNSPLLLTEIPQVSQPVAMPV